MVDLLPGTEVNARGLRWEIVFTQPAGEQRLYRLRCLESGLSGHTLDLLVPFEHVEPIATEMAPTKGARLQDWRVFHDAFLLEQALGPHALLAAQPGRLKLASYQLVPVMRALRMARPRLLLADDVGLGKTIEAGLVLVELIARRRAHRALIVSPAGPLLLQWQAEMRERFGLRFRILDADALEEIRFASEIGANPFDHEALGLISIDFAKQEKVLQYLERTQFDVVIIDEAHHCVSLGAAGDREDSQRRRLAELLARRGDALLLLTATPHDGFDLHFASLVELLDPSLVDGRGGLRGDRYEKHVVRRLKRHIKDVKTGAPMFREREVAPIAVPLDPKTAPRFAAFQEALVSLVAPQLRRSLKRRAYGDVLAFIALLKRSVSTARACASTLEVVADRLGELADKGEEAQEARRQRLRTLRDLNRRRERFGVLSVEEERDQAELEAEDIAAELASEGAHELEAKLGLATREVRREGDRLKQIKSTGDTLRRLAELAAGAAEEDPKLAAIERELVAIRAAEPKANVLIYSEYTDSQDAVVDRLRAALRGGRLTGDVVSIRGGGATDASEAGAAKDPTDVTKLFTSRDDLILVSTDASAEGLNLHERCHHLLHVELPYNPNRIEQRNGRVDRFGQKLDPIVRYLYLAGTFEERLLMRLVAKYERQRKRLGFVPNTLGVTTTSEGAATIRLLEGLADEETALFKVASPSLELDAGAKDDETSVAYRQMLAELDRVFSDFERAARTRVWLGDAGLNAGERHAKEAERAREEGTRLGAVDLLDYVVNALRADSADPQAAKQNADGTWELRIPSAWTFGLDDMPGWDPTTRTLRLTRNLDEATDAQGRAVGYLGRAHPIVRRAIDRVRNIQFGPGGRLLDRRVAAARAEGAAPELLYTFLGRVQSGAGLEFERVVAVRVQKGERPHAMMTLAEWAALGSLDRSVASTNAWEDHFASWATVSSTDAVSAARVAFDEPARVFADEHRELIEDEREGLSAWLRLRAKEICGALDAQAQLFNDGVVPRWKTAVGDLERLSAYATSGPDARARSEARSLLEIFERRQGDLTRRAALEPPVTTPLGLLMLVPEVSRGA
jgi:ERCC4-related helicase